MLLRDVRLPQWTLPAVLALLILLPEVCLAIRGYYTFVLDWE